MITSINREYRARRKALSDREFILEAVLGVDEVLPGSDAEMDDIVDVDSVPDDAYNALDKMLDKIVDDPKYDDTEADELVDDVDEDEVSDEELDAIMESACGWWLNGTAKPLTEGAATEIDEKAMDPKDLNKKLSQHEIHQKKREYWKKEFERYNQSNRDEAAGDGDPELDETIQNLADEDVDAFVECLNDVDGLDEASKQSILAKLKGKKKPVAKNVKGSDKKMTRKGNLMDALKKRSKAKNESAYAWMMESAGLNMDALMEDTEDFSDEEFTAFCEAVCEESEGSVDEAAKKAKGKVKAKKDGKCEDDKDCKDKKAKRKSKFIDALKKRAKKKKGKKNEGYGEDDGLDENVDLEMEDSEIDTLIDESTDLDDESFDELCEAVAEDDLEEGVKEFQASRRLVHSGNKMLKRSYADSKHDTPQVPAKGRVVNLDNTKMARGRHLKKSVTRINGMMNRSDKEYDESYEGAYGWLRAMSEASAADLKDWDPEKAQDQAHQMGTAQTGDDFKDWEDTSCPHTGEPENNPNFPEGGNFNRPGEGFDNIGDDD